MLNHHAKSADPLVAHQQKLRECRRCPQMIPPVIVGPPIWSRLISIGQAPGPHEAKVGHPFGWTAGKTLFEWFASIGVSEAHYRQHVYMAAVCRCFPGKPASQGKNKSGDRVPSASEIANCQPWLQHEFELLQPELLILIGKLAIQQYLPANKLADVVGKIHHITLNKRSVDILPLPHPSGLSTWFRIEPGKTLLQEALSELSHHPAWQRMMQAQNTNC